MKELIGMEKFKQQLNKSLTKLISEGKENKGREYRFLWVSVNLAVAKDNHIALIGARAFGIFMVIRAYMNKENQAWPSLETIAFQSGCSMTTLQKEIQTLVQNAWIKKEGRVRKENGQWGNTIYLILQQDLIRGTGQKGFLKQPLMDSTNGEDG